MYYKLLWSLFTPSPPHPPYKSFIFFINLVTQSKTKNRLLHEQTWIKITDILGLKVSLIFFSCIKSLNGLDTIKKKGYFFK